MTTLVLLVGLPGAGKTTVARALEIAMPAARLSPDEELRARRLDLYDEAARGDVEHEQWELAQELLAGGTSVVVENGLWLRAHREPYLAGGRALGVRVELRHLDVPVDELWRRLARRNLLGTEVVVARGDLLRWASVFEPPAVDELASYD